MPSSPKASTNKGDELPIRRRSFKPAKEALRREALTRAEIVGRWATATGAVSLDFKEAEDKATSVEVETDEDGQATVELEDEAVVPTHVLERAEATAEDRNPDSAARTR